MFGYPLVLMDVSRQTFLERPGMTGAPLVTNELSHLRSVPDASFTDVVSPNAYGTDYAKRAFVAFFGLGANLDADAIYPHTNVDGNGQPLDGGNSYRLHFEAGQTPPANAFWSLTMYDENQYFVDNALDRYAIGDRDPLVANDDGSIDIWLQHESPGPEREPNWLPAPSGSFNVILRIYWPKQDAIDAGWRPPPIERI